VESRPPVRQIQAEVSFVRHKQNTRPMMNVAVIVDVDQQVAGNGLLLNPAVEDRYEFIDADRSGIRGKKLDPEAM
jgi:hypothetical protein